MSLQDCLVIEAGWPPKKGSRRRPSPQMLCNSRITLAGNYTFLPGRSTVMKLELQGLRSTSSSS
jgi:hypothetical protein